MEVWCIWIGGRSINFVSGTINNYIHSFNPIQSYI